LRNWVVLLLLIAGVQFLPGQNVKTVYIPEDIRAEENTAKETVVRELSEQEIFKTGFLYCVDDSLYFFNPKPPEIVKLTLHGDVVKRIHKYGRGPCEYIDLFNLWPFKGNLALMDGTGRKVIFYTKDLECLSEFKLTYQFLGIFINKNNECVLFNEANLDRYFWVYSEDGKFLRKFGKPLHPKNPDKTGKDRNQFDSVRHIIYTPEKDGLWASFRNRYDLRYYEKEKLVGEIRAKEGYFRWKEKEMMNMKWKSYIDYPKYIAGSAHRLFYFIKKDEQIFCDVFDLNDYRLLRRIKLKVDYRVIAHYKGTTFYALAYDESENVLLFKIEV